MNWSLTYPQGLAKAVTFSYDDGQAHDRRLVKIFNTYGVKGTFHLNSGRLDTEGFVTRAEIPALYAGHEVSCHGVDHAWLTHLSKEQLVREVWEDRRALEGITGSPVCGMSYAFGVYSDEAVALLGSLGVEYARTTVATKKFAVPANFLTWHPTCHHNDGALGLAGDFLQTPAFRKLPLFYIWGHSYEFDRQNNWDLIESICAAIANKPDVWYTTNIDYKRYITAARSLISTVDGTVVHNPSGIPVWIEAGGKLIDVRPGQTVTL